MGMPFKGRYDRFRKLQKERMGGRPDDRAPCDEMERGDGLAMLIAALITIVPVCLVMLAILALAGYFSLSDKKKRVPFERKGFAF